jgi:superfamily I DNA/RNA helicase
VGASIAPLLSGEARIRLDRYSEAGNRLLSDFLCRVTQWAEKLAQNRRWLVLSGVLAWMREHAKDAQEVEDLQLAACYLDRLPGSFARREVLFRQSARTPSEDAVALLTIHGAKGLEWDYVWVAACEQPIIPGNGVVEEERRLMYVAMTRARKYLSLSSVSPAPASQFVVEACL